MNILSIYIFISLHIIF